MVQKGFLYFCVLITVDPGTVLEVVSTIRELDTVGLVQPTTGPFDVVVFLRLFQVSDIGSVVVKQLQTIRGVRETLTLTIMRDTLDPMHWLRDGSLTRQEQERSLYAYILVTVEPQALFSAIEKIVSIDEVALVESSAGPYDLVTLVKALTPSHLQEIVYHEIRAAPGLISTLTLVAFEDALEPIHWFQKDLASLR